MKAPHDDFWIFCCISLAGIHWLSTSGCAESPTSSSQQISQATATSESIDLIAAKPLHSWKFVVIHHSATESGSVESIHQTHRQRRDAAGNPWQGIGYHFVIGNGHGMPDGEVQSTFRWDEQKSGAHAGDRNYNDFGIGICLIGNFEKNGPTPAQVRAAQNLIGQLKYKFDLTTEQILKHGDLKATACPGRLFPFQKIATVPAAGVQLAEAKQRPRFTAVKPGHMEGIRNVAAIQRSRSSQRTTTGN